MEISKRKKPHLPSSVVAALVLLGLACASWPALAQENAATVQNLGFDFTSSKLEITFDKDVTFKKSVLKENHQVVIEIGNAKIPKKWARRLDTSQSKGNVLLISPYQSGNAVQVVFQLKPVEGDSDGVDVSLDGKKIVATVENKSSDGSVASAPEAPPSPEPVAPAAEAAAPEPMPAPAASAPAPDGAASGSSIEAFLDAKKNKNYVGKHIWLQVREAELPDVFRIISEASEFNIIVSDAVKGKVMLNLTDVPWDQALDIILTSYRLAAERNGNVLRVTTIDALTREKEAEAAAKKASEAAEPLVVKIFPISYADPTALARIITDFLSKESAMAANGQPVLRGSLQVDNRTNSLVIRDTASTIEKIKRIVKELDTQTPQILIEGKFVEVKETNAKDINGRLFSSSREFNNGTYSFNGNKGNYGVAFGNPSDLPAAFSITPVATGLGGSLGFSVPRAGLLPGLGEIGAFLSILESETRNKVIASPRIVTQNKVGATLTQGTTISYPNPVGGIGASGSFTTINAVLKIDVTPQVTNDGSIMMKINLSQDTPAANLPTSATFATDTKSINTNVMVDSGGTLVIGGIYSSAEESSEGGIPLLRELPLIGPFFGSKHKGQQKNELFIFLTPRILNEKEAGMKG